MVCRLCLSCPSCPTQTSSHRGLCAAQNLCGALPSCRLLSTLCTLLAALEQADLHVGCASHQGRAGPAAWAAKFTLCLEKRAIPAAARAACGCIKETCSKSEKPNKAVKPNFCNYVQQLHRTMSFYVRRLTKSQIHYYFPVVSYFGEHFESFGRTDTCNFTLKG